MSIQQPTVQNIFPSLDGMTSPTRFMLKRDSLGLKLSNGFTTGKKVYRRDPSGNQTLYKEALPVFGEAYDDNNPLCRAYEYQYAFDKAHVDDSIMVHVSYTSDALALLQAGMTLPFESIPFNGSGASENVEVPFVEGEESVFYVRKSMTTFTLSFVYDNLSYLLNLLKAAQGTVNTDTFFVYPASYCRYDGAAEIKQIMTPENKRVYYVEHSFTGQGIEFQPSEGTNYDLFDFAKLFKNDT